MFLVFLSVRNVESKFRSVDHESIAGRALAAGATDEALLHQLDQFYEVPRGRLKLRTIDGVGSELIAYHREDDVGARASDYGRYATKDLTSLADVLARALPRAGVLEKERHLLILQNTRIHLDDVVGLGRFVELETVITTQSEDDAGREHLAVINVLGLGDTERVAVAYVDLSKERSSVEPRTPTKLPTKRGYGQKRIPATPLVSTVRTTMRTRLDGGRRTISEFGSER